MFIPVFIARTNTITIAECTESYSLQEAIYLPYEEVTELQEDEIEIEIAEDKRYLSESEVDMLARLVMAEAGGECFEGKVAVAIVVLNRIKSNEFPADIESVITQPKQFSPVESGKWQRITASVECFEAVDVALSNADNGQGALFFESCTGESWQSNNREYLYQIGNHRFYR
nr:MAG TPA: lytic transglycosylase [Caudoviricetes sp.]